MPTRTPVFSSRAMAVTALDPRMVPRMVCGRRNFQKASLKATIFWAGVGSGLCGTGCMSEAGRQAKAGLLRLHSSLKWLTTGPALPGCSLCCWCITGHSSPGFPVKQCRVHTVSPVRQGGTGSSGSAHQRASTRRRGRHLQAATPTPCLLPLWEWGPCRLLLLLLLVDQLWLLHLLLLPSPERRCCCRRRLEGQASPNARRTGHLSRCVEPARYRKALVR